MKIKLSKSQWEEMGKKAGWMKKAQFLSNFDELELSTTPTGEECAQVGAKEYDYYELSKMELKAFYHQILRMFPNPPVGVSFKKKSNSHDFGSYYDLAIRFDSEDEAAVDYAFKVENNLPKLWDAEAKQELQAQGYFDKLKGKKEPHINDYDVGKGVGLNP